MRCRECEASLWSYIDGELPEARQRLVDAHLASCARCALALERLRAFPLRPGALSVITPPPDFTTRLMRRIEPLPPPRELLLPTPLPFRGPVGAAVAFAAAAAALLLGLISTSTLALLSGRSLAGPILTVQAPLRNLPNLPSLSTGDLLQLGTMAGVWMLFSWPVLAAIAGMLLALALLWFRLVSPRRALDRRR
jgi:hypothetical protein